MVVACQPGKDEFSEEELAEAERTLKKVDGPMVGPAGRSANAGDSHTMLSHHTNVQAIDDVRLERETIQA